MQHLLSRSGQTQVDLGLFMDANHLDYGAATAQECAISYIHGAIYVQ